MDRDGQGWTGVLLHTFANFYRVITSEPKHLRSVLRRARSAVLLPKQWMPQGGPRKHIITGAHKSKAQGRKAARPPCVGPLHFGSKREDRHPASR